MPQRGPYPGIAGRLYRIGFAPKLLLALPSYDRRKFIADAISSGLSPQAGIYPTNTCAKDTRTSSRTKRFRRT